MEYDELRFESMAESAIYLAGHGKVGALNLLFKRHLNSISSSIFQILSAIPETVPVKTYIHLLPGREPQHALNICVKDDNWVECMEMTTYINNILENDNIDSSPRSENIIKDNTGPNWPSHDEILTWYKNRAREIDSLSGQLENSLYLIDAAVSKGFCELQKFHKDILYLFQLIYFSDDSHSDLSLMTWEQLSDYEKFKMMLANANEENITVKLQYLAIPFMREQTTNNDPIVENRVINILSLHHVEESFLVRWMKELSMESNLHLCSRVIEESCMDLKNFFGDIIVAVNCALHCIYLSPDTDKWAIMSDMIFKLKKAKGSKVLDKNLEQHIKLAEAHIEAGRLLEFYQVPKQMRFFLEAPVEEKPVVHIIRLMLSKFARRHPVRADNEWMTLWNDLQFLVQTVFLRLNPDFVLVEFCRGLLKAGKFSLARDYLDSLNPEKAETLVIQAAREYFFSASSLSCIEICKAKECLALLPGGENIQSESKVIEALTVKLPALGVTLLPMQFKQINDPIEVIKMIITTHPRIYLQVDELIEVANLLGYDSPGDISSIEEAIARAAAAESDIQFAYDMCLNLVKKGHAPIWDLCSAIARGPTLDNMDTVSQKQLLGFTLSHCDDESVGELLDTWKDFDFKGKCEHLFKLTAEHSPSLLPYSEGGVGNCCVPDDGSGAREDLEDNNPEVVLNKAKCSLSSVARNLPVGINYESGHIEDKVLAFASSQLPWLIQLCGVGNRDQLPSPSFLDNKYSTVQVQALVVILSWLERNGLVPKDEMILSLAKLTIDDPDSEYVNVCALLLNLLDPLSGVEFIEKQIRTQEQKGKIYKVMNAGIAYSSLNAAGVELMDSLKRRELLTETFQKKDSSCYSEDMGRGNEARPSFWKAWKLKLMEAETDANLNDRPSNVEDKTSESNHNFSGKMGNTREFNATLVALKSSEIAATISSTLEITPDDLSEVESAVSCFSKLCQDHDFDTHLDELVSILEEWEFLFARNLADTEITADVANDNWSNDDWDDGWGSFEDDDELQEEEKATAKGTYFVNPLHSCWMMVISKLLCGARVSVIFQLLDRSLAKSSGCILDEHEAKTMVSNMSERANNLTALKFALLLPYEEISSHHLKELEANLTTDLSVPDMVSGDLEFLILILYSGKMGTVMSLFPSIFSCLCYTSGNLTRHCREARLSNEYDDTATTFRRILFPHFICELVLARQWMLAGMLVSKFMGMSSSISLVNVVEALLVKYLEFQLEGSQELDVGSDVVGPFKNVISELIRKLNSRMESALGMLSRRI